MEKNIFEFGGAIKVEVTANEEAQTSDFSELSDLHLALIGGGIGNTVL